jgi:hypothetical protein
MAIKKCTKPKAQNTGSKKNFKLSSRAIERAKAAGLPDPTPHSREQFIELQKQWYEKLAKSGFKDLEWVDHTTGLGHDTPHLKGSLSLGRTYHPGRALYYDMALAYLTHCRSLSGFNRFIWRLHANGATYDQIMDALRSKYKHVPSKYTVFYTIQKLAKLCYRWNRKYPEGILVKRTEDRSAIVESFIAEIIATEYNWIIGEEEL